MTNTFSTTGTTSHSSAITGLTNGQSYSIMRCRDAIGNANTDDFVISFNIAAAVNQPPVFLTSPLSGSTFIAPANFIDSFSFDDGTIQRVEFL